MKKIFVYMLALALVLSMGLVMTGPLSTPVAAANGPPVETGLVLHVDASDVDSVTRDGANKVSAWADLSPEGNDAGQATAANQPEWVPDVLFGKPVVRFDGTNTYMATGAHSPEAGQPNTVFVVWSVTASTGAEQFATDGFVNSNRQIVRWRSAADGVGGYAGSHYLKYAKGIPFGHMVSTVVFDGANSEIYENGEWKAAGNAGAHGYGGLTIGARYTGDQYFLDGDIAEILIYDRALSNEERVEVEQYLESKWLQAPDEVWVSEATGSDTNPGTQDYPFKTIKKGIDVVAEGGTVNVKAGTYVEDGLDVDRSLTIIGAGETGTIVEIDRATEGYGIQTSTDSDLELTFEDMTFKAIDNVRYFFFHIAHNKAFTLENVTVIGMGKDYYDGHGTGWANTVGGVDLINLEYCTLTNVTVSETSRNAVSLSAVKDIAVENINVFASGARAGSAAVAIYNRLDYPDNNPVAIDIDGGTITGAPIGMNLGDTMLGVVTGDDIRNVVFTDNAVQAVASAAEAEALLAHNTFDRAVVVRGSTIQVPVIFSSIQDAIDAAVSGQTVDVAAGTYTEYLVITTDNLTLQGAGIDQSIIDLDGLKPYWHYPGGSYASRAGVLITGYGSSGDVVEDIVFKGFTVKNAGINPPTPYTEYIDRGDGHDIVRGIAVQNAKNIHIHNCKVENSGWYGIVVGRPGGFAGSSEGVTIDYCIVTDNWETGIHVADYIGPITITHNESSRNKRPFTDGGRYFSGKGIQVGGKGVGQEISGLIAYNECFDNGYEGIRIHDYSDGVVVEHNQVGGHNVDSSSSGIFITASGSDPTRCINNVIRYNDLTGDIRGIVAYYAQYCTIEGNTITTDSGDFSSGQEAIRIDGGNNMLIKDNILTDCDGVGIGIKTTWNNVEGYENTVTGNVITRAKWAGVLLWIGARDNTVSCNTITETRILTRGVDLTYGDGVLLPGYSEGAKPGTGNVFNYNNIYDNEGYGLNNEAAVETVDATHNWWGSPNGPTHAGNTFNVGDQGDAVSDNALYVPWLDDAHPDGESFAPVWLDQDGDAFPFSSIQAAIDAATGSTITCAPGTYTENIIIDKRVTLTGAGSGDDAASDTIITPADEGTTVVTISAAGASATERLTLSNLRVAGTGANSHGIRITSVGSFITFDNVAAVGHGNRGVSGEWSGVAQDIQFLNCTFNQNVGVAFRTGSAAQIRGLTITETSMSDNDFGAYLDGAVTGVAITGGSFDNNQGAGTSGVGIWAQRFDLFDDADKLPNVLTGFTANNNRRGVILHTYGPFEISDASASNNLEEGITFNTRATGPGLILIRNVVAINNPKSNLWAIKFGDTEPISLSIEDCTLSGSTGDGFPGWGYGLYLYAAHRPWSDVTVFNCTMKDNATGVYMRALSATASITGVSIVGCSIEDNETGILITEHASAGNSANFNNIAGNTAFGVQNNHANMFDATHNWWGAADGPTTSPGSGDKVSANVDYDHWLGAPLYLPAVYHDTLTAGEHIVDATDQADTVVEFETTGPTEIYVARYESQPFADEAFPDEALGKYIDIQVSNPENVVWPVYVRVYYTTAEVNAAGIDEKTLGLYYYSSEDGGFHRCSDTGVNTAEKFIWANITAEEAGYLAGSPFGTGGNPLPPPQPPTAGSAYPIWAVLLAGLMAGATLLALRRRQTQS